MTIRSPRRAGFGRADERLTSAERLDAFRVLLVTVAFLAMAFAVPFVAVTFFAVPFFARDFPLDLLGVVFLAGTAHLLMLTCPDYFASQRGDATKTRGFACQVDSSRPSTSSFGTPMDV